jgi:hypothetical protein
MTCPFEEKIPFMVSGQLPPEEAAHLKAHLVDCAECRSEIDFWTSVAGEVIEVDANILTPVRIDNKVLYTLHPGLAVQKTLRRTFSLLKAQAYLVRREMWPATAGIMALGVIMVILSKELAVLTFLAPLVAAASLAAIYGPQNDPASELALATPTSSWKVLLARLTLVSGYNFILALVSSLVLLLIFPVDILGSLILSWFGPLTLLSALALMLSLWIGTANAITVTYALWISQYIRPTRLVNEFPSLQIWDKFLTGYRQFWLSPGLLVMLAVLIILASLISTRFTPYNRQPYTG